MPKPISVERETCQVMVKSSLTNQSVNDQNESPDTNNHAMEGISFVKIQRCIGDSK